MLERRLAMIANLCIDGRLRPPHRTAPDRTGRCWEISGPGASGRRGYFESMTKRTQHSPGVRADVTALNVVALCGAVVFAAAGVARPSLVHAGSSSPRDLGRVWAAASALRTAGIVLTSLWLLRRRHPAATLALTVAGSMQLGDSLLGVWQRNLPMSIASAMMGTLHLVTARKRA